MSFPYPYPLGLPKGSVRATITMLLSIDLLLLTFEQNTLAERFAAMTVVALTFYFGGKMRASAIVPHDVDASQRAWGLPAGTIRTFLIILYSSSSAYIYYIEGTIPKYIIEIMYLIAGYLLGRLFQKLFLRFKKNEKNNGIVDHLKAIVVLITTILVIYLSQVDPLNSLTILLILINNILLGFYFGARE